MNHNNNRENVVNEFDVQKMYAIRTNAQDQDGFNICMNVLSLYFAVFNIYKFLFEKLSPDAWK